MWVAVNQKLLISDANILIDVIAGGIVDEMFALNYEFGVPDVLFHYELKGNHPELPGKGLKVMGLAAATIVDIVQLNAKHAKAGVSNNDCMALALARQEDCPLLTGDGALRQVALDEGAIVRGTLWLVEEMFNAGLVDLDGVTVSPGMKSKNRSRDCQKSKSSRKQEYGITTT